MSKMNMMETIVLDVMDTQDGVKILEFQDLLNSAIGKYYQAYGEDLSSKIWNYYHPDGDVAFDVHHPILNEICCNKNMMAAFAGSHAKDLFPKQKIYVFGDKKYSPQTILNDFPNTKSFVFKEPEKFEGKGVFIVSREELECVHDVDDVAKFFKKNNDFSQKKGLFLVQEAVTPKLVAFPNTNGQKGLPAIRLVLTICPRENGEIEFVFHGGYYKFPTDPLPQFDKDITISSKTQSQIKTNCNNGVASRIDANDYKNICNQIEKSLKPFFRTLIEQDCNRIAIERLMNGDLGERVCAALFLNKLTAHQSEFNIVANGIDSLIKRDPSLGSLLGNPTLKTPNKRLYKPNE